jgi:hypothetical protein
MEPIAEMPEMPMMAIAVISIVAIAVAALMIISLWKIFEKAGQPGWACIVPFYNIYILTKIAEKPGYWAVLMCIPYIGLIWVIWVYNRIAKRFGKTEGFTAGMIFLSIIFFPILGFGDAQYKSEGNIADGGEGALDAGVFKN